MKQNLQIAFILLFLCSTLTAQAESVKREFRAGWLSTVWGIDWPTHRDNTAAAEKDQRIEMRQLLDTYVEANLNACFFQVRGMSDAFYNSRYEPWSQYLTGERGKAPLYDPFQMVIDECHKRGIECHAWINPYRYSTSSENHGTGPNDYATTHSDWLLNCGGTVILNPGLPEVRQRICAIVADILEKYDVDGIVFDDYFYVNGATEDTHDQALYDAYLAGLSEGEIAMDRGDWRRHQVNLMVSDVYKTIKFVKPWVRFGISPAGVAASNADVAAKYGVAPCPSGSDWQYNGLYSEPVQWLMDNTIDYISPQVYWTIGANNDYSKIVPWWGMVAHKFNRHNYTSASLSALAATPTGGRGKPGATEIEMQRIAAATHYDAHETVNEIIINRESAKEGAPGMVFFSSTPIARPGFIPTITKDVFSRKALVPALTWYKAEEQGLVTDLQVRDDSLRWSYSKPHMRYTIYAMPKEERANVSKLATSEYFVATTYDMKYPLPEGVSAATHAIAVCVFDRYGNEFAPRFLGEALATAEVPQLLLPEDKANVLLPGWLTWKPVTDAMAYTVELAYDDTFVDIIACAQVDSNALLTQKFSALDGSKTTYWRVKAHKANAETAYSETRSFSGKLFSVTSPFDGESPVSVVPTIKWDDAGQDATYIVEVATTTSFANRDIVFCDTLTATEITLPEDVLRYSKTYYVRVSATTQYMSVTSLTNAFTTEEVVMVSPIILSPANNATVKGPTLAITVGDTPNNGFRFEVSSKSTFPGRGTKIIQTDPGVRTAVYEELSDGTYYIRVATCIDLSTFTEYSDTICVNYMYAVSGLQNIESRDPYVANGILFAAENLKYSIYTADGRNVHSAITQMGGTTLPTLPQGVYIIRVGEKVIITRK